MSNELAGGEAASRSLPDPRGAAGKSWEDRPFCRDNTQSEPEDCARSTEEDSSEEELECLRCCRDYYCNRREGSDTGRSPAGMERCSASCSRHQDDRMGAGADELSADVGRAAGPLWELSNGFRVVFFVTLPMLARQLGSILSRRVLGRLLGRHAS